MVRYGSGPEFMRRVKAGRSDFRVSDSILGSVYLDPGVRNLYRGVIPRPSACAPAFLRKAKGGTKLFEWADSRRGHGSIWQTPAHRTRIKWFDVLAAHHTPNPRDRRARKSCRNL